MKLLYPDSEPNLTNLVSFHWPPAIETWQFFKHFSGALLLGVFIFPSSLSLASNNDDRQGKRMNISGLWEYVCTRSSNKVFEHYGWQHGGIVSLGIENKESLRLVSATGTRLWIKINKDGTDIIEDLKASVPWDSTDSAFTGTERFLFTYTTHGPSGPLIGYVRGKILMWDDEDLPSEIIGFFSYELPFDYSMTGTIKMRRMKKPDDFQYNH